MGVTKGMLPDFSLEDLRNELKRRDQAAQVAEAERRKTQAEFYLNYSDVLLQLRPKHDNRCTDEKRCEDMCLRCKLLYAREYKHWDHDVALHLVPHNLPPMDEVKATK